MSKSFLQQRDNSANCADLEIMKEIGTQFKLKRQQQMIDRSY